jgi:hypothetical protein
MNIENALALAKAAEELVADMRRSPHEVIIGQVTMWAGPYPVCATAHVIHRAGLREKTKYTESAWFAIADLTDMEDDRKLRRIVEDGIIYQNDGASRLSEIWRDIQDPLEQFAKHLRAVACNKLMALGYESRAQRERTAR